MVDSLNILLCAGPIDVAHLPLGTNVSNAMVPVNGKPVVGWILDDLLAKGIDSATVVLRADDEHLRDFVRWAYGSRKKIETALLEQDGSILHSLQTGLDHSKHDGLVRVILGDTLIRDSYDGDHDFAYISEVHESGRWCLVGTDSDGKIDRYIDKHAAHRNGSLMALAGYYHLTRADLLRQALRESLHAGETELSQCLSRYGHYATIRTRQAREWFDFGHIDNLVDARRRLLQSRRFNRLTINPVLNTITKVSDHNEKLHDELNWYLALPDGLKVLTPRVLKHEVNGFLEVVQDYYGYPTLAELFVYGNLHAGLWMSIVRHVLRVHREFCEYKGQLSSSSIGRMYLEKTIDRLETLRTIDDDWADLLSRETITHNGRELLNLPRLESEIQSRATALASSTDVCLIHGDLCFSNILFDVTNQIVRLIDPRGSFGEKGIYGDPRYDIAKLRHSIRGHYDFILADLFCLTEESPGQFESQLYIKGAAVTLNEHFDDAITESGYDLDEIRWIEGLLFLTMPPLHSDEPQRQRMMYLLGLELLNDVLESNSDTSTQHLNSCREQFQCE